MSFDTATAEHEAAHVVVGAALGLRLRKATIAAGELNGHVAAGYSWFYVGRKYMAFGIMACAGIAWERKCGRNGDAIAGDLEIARQVWDCRRSEIETGVRLARELIDARARIHSRIASKLCDRDLGPGDLERLIVG